MNWVCIALGEYLMIFTASGRRDYVTEKVNENCEPMPEANNARVAWMLLDERAVDAFGRPAFNFYQKIKGFFEVRLLLSLSPLTLLSLQGFDNLNKLLEYTKWNKSAFEATIRAYSAASSGKEKDQFGRTSFLTSFDHIIADGGAQMRELSAMLWKIKSFNYSAAIRSAYNARRSLHDGRCGD